jgi:hypothetical protein
MMPETVFNGFEAALWLAFAVVVVVRFREADAGTRNISRVMAAFFVLFGVSDIIEMKTGAWWRPPALLVFKGVCLIGLTACFVSMLRRHRTAKRTSDVDQNQDRD